MTLRVVIPGSPVPKERARSGLATIACERCGHLNRATGGRHYTPDATRAYERHVKGCFTAEILRQRWPKFQPEDRYDVHLDIYLADYRRRDGSNVCKAVEDAGNQAVWEDDSQIVHMDWWKHHDPTRPRVEMIARRMRGGM